MPSSKLPRTFEMDGRTTGRTDSKTWRTADSLHIWATFVIHDMLVSSTARLPTLPLSTVRLYGHPRRADARSDAHVYKSVFFGGRSVEAKLCTSTLTTSGFSSSKSAWTNDDAIQVYTTEAVNHFLGNRTNPNGEQQPCAVSRY